VPEKRMLKNEIRHISLRLINGIFNYINERRQKLEYLKRAPVFKRPETYVNNYRLIIDQLFKLLQKDVDIYISKQKSILNHNITRLEALNPLSILKRGYSVCIHADTNNVVKQLNDVEIGDPVVILLSDGSLLCNVKDSMRKGEDK
jgi:exodeoxyribonuclease VII large subunit